MSEITFPSGFDWQYRITQACDFIPEDYQIGVVGTTYNRLQTSCLKIFPDLSNAYNLQSMFSNCTKLLTVSSFDSTNAKYMSYMFSSCTSLQVVPQLTTSNAIEMNSMFDGCKQIKTVPLFDTSNVTYMNYIFYNCSSLETIPAFDTSKLYSANGMFDGCTSLKSLPLLDFSSAGYMSSFFGSSYLITTLTDLGGFKNLGKESYISGVNTNYFLYMCPNLTYESIMNVINNLYDRATAGYSVVTLKLHANTLALLSDDDKAIATNKGWTLA